MRLRKSWFGMSIKPAEKRGAGKQEACGTKYDLKQMRTYWTARRLSRG
jgi:hypothetical protein